MKGIGTVTSVDGNKARVQVTAAAECMECSVHCHSRPDGSSKREIVVSNDHGARVSDSVVFEAEPGKVVLSAVLVWIVPIVAMIVGYWAAQHYSSGFVPIAAAFIFLGCAFGILKLVDSLVTGGRAFYPKIIKIVDPSGTGYCDINNS